MEGVSGHGGGGRAGAGAATWPKPGAWGWPKAAWLAGAPNILRPAAPPSSRVSRPQRYHPLPGSPRGRLQGRSIAVLQRRAHLLAGPPGRRRSGRRRRPELRRRRPSSCGSGSSHRLEAPQTSSSETPEPVSLHGTKEWGRFRDVRARGKGAYLVRRHVRYGHVGGLCSRLARRRRAIRSLGRLKGGDARVWNLRASEGGGGRAKATHSGRRGRTKGRRGAKSRLRCAESSKSGGALRGHAEHAEGGPGGAEAPTRPES